MSDYNPDADPRSSNSLIRAYLASKGLPANGGNVRTALSGNAANPGMIPGLVNSTPSTEADDQAAMAAAAGRRGIGGNSGVVARAGPARPELPDSAPGAETRVGGTGAGGSPNTSAAPTSGGGGGGPPSGDELNSALLATAILGSGAGAGLLTHMWQNRAGASAPAPGVPGEPAPLPGPRIGTQFDPQGKPIYSGGPRGAPGAPELPPLPAGPRSDIPFDAQGKPVYGGGPRGAPGIPGVPEPPIAPVPSSSGFDPQGKPIYSGGPRGEPILPVAPVAPGPLPPQPILTPDQFKAANPATGGVPPAEVAPTGARIRKPRTPRLRL